MKRQFVLLLCSCLNFTETGTNEACLTFNNVHSSLFPAGVRCGGEEIQPVWGDRRRLDLASESANKSLDRRTDSPEFGCTFCVRHYVSTMVSRKSGHKLCSHVSFQRIHPKLADRRRVKSSLYGISCRLAVRARGLWAVDSPRRKGRRKGIRTMLMVYCSSVHRILCARARLI